MNAISNFTPAPTTKLAREETAEDVNVEIVICETDDAPEERRIIPITAFLARLIS